MSGLRLKKKWSWVALPTSDSGIQPTTARPSADRASLGPVGRDDGRQAPRPDHRGGRHALHENFRRLPHRPSHAAAGPLHLERLGRDVGPSGQKHVPGQNYRVDVMASTGLYEDGKKGLRRPTDPALRVKDMDRDGVDAEVIFGILGAATRLNDHEAANEMFRIYNDWLVDFCRHYPDRHIGLACLPYGDIDAAVKEIHRVAKRGLRGMELSCSWDMEPMWHPCWEPLWKAVNEVGLPLHFHTFPSLPPGKLDQQKGLTRRAAFFTAVSSFQMNLINILSAVIGAAVLERYPRMRISFGESGIGWLPYALDRMDFEWEDRFRDLGLTMKPSDYWRRQCKATFQFDRIGTKLIDDIGVETLMWGSDYPHTDGVWPESSKYIEEQFGHLPK